MIGHLQFISFDVREIHRPHRFGKARIPMTRLFAGTPFDRAPTCDQCGKPECACTCPPVLIPKTERSPDKKTARLAVEKRKKGKVVTVIRGLSSTADNLPRLLAQLKSQCGAGGTMDGETLELQGNHVERLRAMLADAGYIVRG